MRRVIALALIVILCLSLSACAAAPEPAVEGLGIVATLFPAYDFARQIAGERAEVTLLVPPGSESHSYEPTPRDIIKIENCDLLFCNGGESEAWLAQLLDGLGEVPRLCMLDCAEALEEETVEGMQRVPGEEEDGGPEYDEHVWTSPVNAALICQALCGELCRIDPEGAEYYKARLEEYTARLSELDGEFRRVVAQGRRKTVVFADRFPARYFTEEYGLEYFAAFPGCADDAEPSAKTVAFLIDKVRREDIPAVFYIEFSNQKMADVIAEDTGCKKLLFHSCHNVGADELERGVTYLELMENDLLSLEEALS